MSTTVKNISQVARKAAHKAKVFVGMSGGVDSSVSAALLKRAGYDVTGVFITVWQPDWIECNWKEERLEAMRAAAHLDIPFITLDLENEYKRGVIDYMINEYAAGRTPNPDVMCNRQVKFGAFWQWAREHGAHYIATGHYARVRMTASPLDNYELLIGIDTNKDQSYFLWTLKQEDLAHVLFPIGHLIKSDVRKLAHKFRLPNADKKDSQGLCFLGKIDVKDFLSHYVRTEQGNVLDENGEVIGHHPGALLFTIGERHGFTISPIHKTAYDSPFFVIEKDVLQNTITVSSKNLAHKLPQAESRIRINNVNWVSGEIPESREIAHRLQARSRYRQELQTIKIGAITISDAEIIFDEPEDTLTPGQSLVIYDGEECLGGGVIE